MDAMWMVAFNGAEGATFRLLIKAGGMDEAVKMAKDIAIEYSESPFEIKNLGPVPALVVGFDEEVL